MKLPEAIKKYDRLYLLLDKTSDWYIEKVDTEKWEIYHRETEDLILRDSRTRGDIPLSMKEILSDKWEEYPRPLTLKEKVIIKLDDFNAHLPAARNYDQTQAQKDLKNLIKEIKELDWEKTL